MHNIAIVCSDPNIPQFLLKELESLGTVELHARQKMSIEESIELLKNTSILICGASGFDGIPSQLIDQLPNLQFITVFGVGTDRIDITYAKEKGIIVSNAKGGNAQSVAEHTRGMILDLGKRITEFDRATRTTGEVDVNKFHGREIYGKTLGVIGLGDIGLRIAKIAQGFDMKVLGYNRSQKSVEGIQQVDLEQLLNSSDVIALGLPYTNQTHHFISHDQILEMKKDVILVNCTREHVVDKEAVVAGIKSGKIFGYGVETEIFEPVKKDDIYYSVPNIVLTPHNAWNTKESDENIFKISVENVRGFVQNETKNVVN